MTEISEILEEVRGQLRDLKSKKFWSDKELKALLRHGALDLWGAILDLHAEHYMVNDETHVVLKAGAYQLSGVPENCFRVLLIEPRGSEDIVFKPRKFNDPKFAAARTIASSQTIDTGEIYFHVTGVGSPIEAPKILTAPALGSDLEIRLAYCPTITIDAVNPIPGESDHALKAWTIAMARAKETEGQIPDAGWLSVYNTEKQSILVRLSPRQEQEPEYVEALYEGYW